MKYGTHDISLPGGSRMPSRKKPNFEMKKTKSQVTTIQDLVPEILVRVFSYIEYEHSALVNLRLVSHRFRDVIKTNSQALCNSILNHQFWREKLVSRSSTPTPQWLNALQSHKLLKETLLETIVRETGCLEQEEGLLRAGIIVIARSSCLQSMNADDKTRAAFKMCHRISTDGVVRIFCTRLVQAAICILKKKGDVHIVPNFTDRLGTLQWNHAPLAVETMTIKFGVQYACWLLDILPTAAFPFQDEAEIGLLKDHRFQVLDAEDSLLDDILAGHDQFLTSQIATKYYFSFAEDSEAVIEAARSYVGLALPDSAARAVRLKRAALRSYIADWADVDHTQLLTDSELLKKYEQCHLKIKKEPIYEGAKGVEGAEVPVHRRQLTWFWFTLTNPSEGSHDLLRQMYDLQNERQVLQIAGEDFECFLAYKDESFEGLSMVKALNRANSCAGVKIITGRHDD